MDKLVKLYKQNEKVILGLVGLICLAIIIQYVFRKESLDEIVEDADVDAQVEEPKEEVMPVEDGDHSAIPEGQQVGGPEISPADLLPMSQDVVNFTQQFPGGESDVKDKNFLIAGFNIGINTVASSLKNPNLQLRSDPYIPRQDTGPWNQSTIMSSDLTNRKPLEIGTTL
jgi:hypothetical protein